MIPGFPATARRLAFITATCTVVVVSAALPGSPQMRGMMKDKIVDSVANTLVSNIHNSSCADFAAMLKSRKGGTGSSSGKASGMMKSDPEARQRFVNKVAGPLVNKMIDCDLLPSR